MTLTSLADLRRLIGHLPAQHRAKTTWQQVAAELKAAAHGADPTEVPIALRLVLMLEGVPCHVQ